MVASVCDNVQVIPHVIPNLNPTIDVSTPSLPTEKRLLIVFGFIRRSKGHDLAIKALARMKHEASLVIAGGVRTRGDLIFLRECLRLADRLGVAGRVRVTGYVPENSITALYRRAVLAVAPFRQSSGSGSLAIGLASGTPTVASDISLNKEILEREPGCLTLFASENPEKLAEEVDRLLDSQVARESIVRAARRYARSCSPSKIAQKHVALYSHFT
jgi:glycosyltransferase involved in cell wall biosynthesis